MRSEGRGSISLFNLQSSVEREIQHIAAERIYDKLGLEKPKNPRIVQSFEIPLIPRQEDFFLFPFRHLSATIVGGGTYKATDFSKDGVLKKAYGLLRGRPAYLNHIQLVGKSVGVVGDTEWVNSYKNAKGDLIPGGIDGPFVIDGILHPELVRELSSPVSPIDSCSVTVVFEWEASHEFENDNDFYWHLGEMIDDGDGEPQMVRRIVTKVIAFEESSLVWMGADPYAKMLSDKGEVINIDRAAAYAKNKFADIDDNRKWDTTARYFVVDCLDKDFLLHLSKSITDLDRPKPEKNIIMDKDLVEFLASHFKTSPEKIKNGEFKKADAEKFVVKDSTEFSKMKTSEDFEKETNAKVKAEGEVTKLTSEVATLKQDKANLETAATANKPLIEMATATIKAAKEEAKRIYEIFAKGKGEKVIQDELEAETSLEKLNAKIKLFGGKAITEFGGKCGDCGSANIDFRSTVPVDENDPTKKKSSGKPNLADGFRR